MANIPTADQWLLDGNCGQCRRANYCSKDCTATKRRRDRIKEQAFRDVLQEKYPELSQVLNSIPHMDDK